MKHIFYLIGMIYAIINLFQAIDPKTHIERMSKTIENGKIHKGKEYNDYPKEYQTQLVHVFFVLVIGFVFMFGGLFTDQWPLFIILMIFDFGVSGLVTKLVKGSIIHPIWGAINGSVCFAIIIFIILNAYHLHIDILQLIVGWVR